MKNLESSELVTVSRSQLQEIADRLGLRLFLKDKNSQYIGCNRHFALDAGYLSPNDVIGKTDNALSWRSNARLCMDNDQHVMADGIPDFEKHECPSHKSESSSAFLTTKIPLRNEEGDITGVFGVYQAQSVPSNTETARARLRRAYQLLIASNHCIIAAQEEVGIFSGICDLVIKNGYKMSWVGIPENDEQKSVRAIAISGSIKGYLDDINLNPCAFLPNHLKLMR